MFWQSVFLPLLLFTRQTVTPPIDRHALVTRHNVHLNHPDPLTPLTVGNGEFAFTADITGLQTFPDFHQKGMALHTQSQWGWHTSPNPQNYRLADVFVPYRTDRRDVLYPEPRNSGDATSVSEREKKAAEWLRANPHRLDLGRLGLSLRHADGRPVRIEDLTETRQTLDLWSGQMESRFTLDGAPVLVQTVCHPRMDALAVRLVSPLLAKGLAALTLAFPDAQEDWKEPANWNRAERHQTYFMRQGNRGTFQRTLDETHYAVQAVWSRGGSLQETAPHHYAIASGGYDTLELVLAFAPQSSSARLPDFARTRRDAAAHWHRFWQSGGAIDFSGSRDSRAAELERRVVLSQYLTAVQCAGSLPPQETGLVQNSWYGKFHLEMHWWHAAHFALWGRETLLEKSLPWYERILPIVQETARRQGYRGARWSKMTAPDGRESPSSVGVFLIWQQPHPIYYAELLYRARPTRKTLERYRTLVFETADFMASYAVWEEAGKRYVLGPPLIPAQETYGTLRAQNKNPTFELAYWRWGLETAQRWRERLGMPREPEWDRILNALAQPTVQNGIYTAIETPPYTIPSDHPSMVAALGFLPRTADIDPMTMRRTLDDVLTRWNLESTWGWDYPMLAMTAARLGEPEKAVSALLMDSPKNGYLANGHNYQEARLPLYLPGNGGLLAAVALMAAGWEGAPDRPNPGFPQDGQWKIRWEGLHRAP